jgi:hypothetical protein
VPRMTPSPLRTSRSTAARRALATTALSAFLAAGALPGTAPAATLATGTFRSLDHATSGRATVVRLASGTQRLSFTSFRLAPGPNVRVWLVAGSPAGTDRYSSRVDLGRIRSFSGNQSYTVPSTVSLARYRTVMLWCVTFRVGLGRADLRLTPPATASTWTAP